MKILGLSKAVFSGSVGVLSLVSVAYGAALPYEQGYESFQDVRYSVPIEKLNAEDQKKARLFISGKSAGNPPSVPITNQFKTMYYGSFELGSRHQPFKVVLDTGSSNIWVPGASCESAGCVGKTRTGLTLTAVQASLPVTKPCSYSMVPAR